MKVETIVNIDGVPAYKVRLPKGFAKKLQKVTPARIYSYMENGDIWELSATKPPELVYKNDNNGNCVKG